MKTMAAIQKQLPSEAKFKMPMVANSETEVWVDIPTHLKHNQAWHIVEVVYGFERIDPTVPVQAAAAADIAMTLQLHRNCAHETLLNYLDDDCLMASMPVFDPSASAPVRWPLHEKVQTFTTQQKLRAIFRTYGDFAGISDATMQLFGVLKYFVVSAPSVGRTKHGLLKEL